MTPSHRTRLAVAFLALVAFASAARPAFAAGPSGHGEAAIVPVFTFHASHGFTAVGWAVPAHSGHRPELLLFFYRKHDFVTYLAPAEVDEEGRIHAGLGALGQVDLQFVASGKVSHLKPPCGGEGLAYSAGRYEGTIDFQGEEGFTAAETDRAELDPKFLLGSVCSGGGYGWTTPGKGGQLVGKGRSGSPAFKAIKKTPDSPSHFSARIKETHGRIAISRYTSVAGAPSDFVFPPRGQRAYASPPAPFSGSAALRGNRWSGNLKVDFAGHSDVRLTGPGFGASLLHASFSGSIARGL